MSLYRSSSIALVGMASKLILSLNKVELKGWDRLIKAIEDRPKGVPLITYCNHTSTVDDPLLFGLLPTKLLLSHNQGKMRWSLGAKEILFINPLFSSFFSAGKVLPIERGAGLFQPSMLECHSLLKKGDWIHIFPEGQIYPHSSQLGPFKWGIGHLIRGCLNQNPIILPIRHKGLEDLKPLKKFFRFGTHIKVKVGDAIPLQSLPSEPSQITDELRKHMESLK